MEPVSNVTVLETIGSVTGVNVTGNNVAGNNVTSNNVASPLKEIWLAGKGPSLDSYDWSQANQYRIGINETAFIVPNCWGAIAIDYRVLDKYKGVTYKALPKELLVFRKDCHTRYVFPNMYVWSKGKEVKFLYGTAAIAIQLFHYLGAEIIHLVGFDSFKGDARYAHSIQLIKGEGLNRDRYKRVNEQLTKIIDLTKVKVIVEC